MRSEAIRNENKILIVDDEKDISYLTKRMLEQEGYRVMLAESGSEGIKKAVEDKPDAILLDIRLPDANGWDVCRELKELKETRNIPIAMFSVKTKKEEELDFEHCGCCAYIEKPFTRDELINGVKSLLNERNWLKN